MPVSLFLTTANDYVPHLEMVLIPPGDDSAMVVVELKEDKMIEGNEIFFGVISAEDVLTSVTSGTASVTIIDNDGECIATHEGCQF